VVAITELKGNLTVSELAMKRFIAEYQGYRGFKFVEGEITLCDRRIQVIDAVWTGAKAPVPVQYPKIVKIPEQSIYQKIYELRMKQTEKIQEAVENRLMELVTEKFDDDTLSETFLAGSTEVEIGTFQELQELELPDEIEGFELTTDNIDDILQFFLNGRVLCTVDNTTGSRTGNTLSCTSTAPATSGTFTITAEFTAVSGPGATGTVPLVVVPGIACTGGDPHIICLDGSRLDVYDGGYYRLFDNLQESSQSPVIINAQIVRDRKTHEDSYSKVWIKLANHEYHLDFLTYGVRCQSSRTMYGFNVFTNHGTNNHWEQSYTSASGKRMSLHVS
jgi:hypothetical protein